LFDYYAAIPGVWRSEVVEVEMKIAQQVAALEETYDDLAKLCDEMIATLLIAQNEDKVDPLIRREAWGWREKYRLLTRKAPNPHCENCDGTGSGLYWPDGPCGACWE
jgi:hypothetical protein